MSVDDKQLAEMIAEAESQRINQLREANIALNRTIAEERDARARYEEAVYKAVRDVQLAVDLPPVPKPPPDRRRKHAPEVAVPWLSDLQLGKKTPDYDSEVAAERIELWGDKVLDIVSLHRQVRPITKAQVWIMGDIVEGEDIFPGQEYLIDSSLYWQVSRNAPMIMASFLRRLLGSFDEVHVVAVIGNHGRVGRRGQLNGETNMDRMAYRITATMLADEPRLTWQFAEPDGTGDRGWHSVATIGNYRCLLVHGDQFRGSLGVPWYGIRKKVLGWKAMGTAEHLPFPDFDDVAFGHWHQPVTWTINGIGVRGCGSPESWNEYAAENLAGMSRPSQRLMFVSPDAGHVTAEYPEVWLDDDDQTT